MRVSSIYMTSDKLICIVTWQEIHIVGMKVFKKKLLPLYTYCGGIFILYNAMLSLDLEC